MAVVQYTYTHKLYRGTSQNKQYIEQHKNTYQNNTTTRKSAGRAPSFAGFTLAFALQLRRKHGENITVYLPHSCYVFRYAIHHLDGRLLVFLLKSTCFFTLLLLCTVSCLIQYKMHPGYHSVIDSD